MHQGPKIGKEWLDHLLYCVYTLVHLHFKHLCRRSGKQNGLLQWKISVKLNQIYQLHHTRYVTKMMIYLPLGAQAVLYLCLLQLARDGQHVGRVVVVRLGFALVLVLLLLRWCLMAAVLVFIVVVVEDYAVSAQVQALASPVAWFPPHGPIGERSV